MASIELSGIWKTYDKSVHAVRDVSLDIADGEFVVLVGPSGCGKSTTLRMIAGLEEISDGTISIGGRVVNTIHPKDRDIAMVFQNYALYPHMSVYKNMAFALKLRKVPKDEIDRRVRDAARILGIEDYLERKPKALSGGQRQRVAVGRAIVREPKAFLFDEPLSNLDAKLRVTTRAELKQLHQRLKTTTIYVTHDQEEAMTLGDLVVVMANGVIQQADSPFEVYQHPANRFVASFIGMPPMNLLKGTITRQGGAGQPGRAWFVETGTGGMRIELSAHASASPDLTEGRAVQLGIRPQFFFEPGRAGRSAGSGQTARITPQVIEPLGDLMDVHSTTGVGTPIVARIPAHAGLPTGTPVELGVETDRVLVFADDEDGANLAPLASAGQIGQPVTA